MNILFWHWWVLALGLIAIEVLTPTIFFLWFGLSALLVGAICWVYPAIAWQIQFVLFAVLAAVATAVGRKYVKRGGVRSDQPLLNQRGKQLVGRVVTLTEAIQNGSGRTLIDGNWWRVAGADLAAGTTVAVTGADGVTLNVQKK